MSKVTKFSNDDCRLSREVPVHTESFQINPVVSSKVVKLKGSMVYKDEEVIEEVVFKDVEWYRVSWEESDELFFPMGNDFLKEW